MPKLTIQLDLSDEDAAPFQGREAVIVIPAMVAEYQGFLDHGSRIETGLATCAEAVAAMLDPDHPGDKAEGLRRIASVIDALRGSHAAVGDFFAPHAATSVIFAGTGRVN